MKEKRSSFSRRKFLKNSAVGAAGLIVAPTILSSCAKGANNKIQIAHIGLGSRGQTELQDYFINLDSSLSVATCDPFKKRRESAAAFISVKYKERGIKAPKCKSYLHFNEILERDDIDAVHITTPDFWHVPLAIHAARAGKHIMLAKPLGLSYPNYKILEKELKANNVRFHYGTQQRSMKHFKRGVEMIKEGLIGEVERVEIWCQGYNPVDSPVCHEVPVPDDFDYDLWTGPAPMNPYCPERVTNNGTWFQSDYSIGFLAGWGAHPIDIMLWALKDKMSGKYSCEGTGEYWKPGGMYNNIRAWDVNMEYESGLKLRYVDNDYARSSDFLKYRKHFEHNGTTFFGTKGWISLSRASAESNIPELEKKLNDFPKWEGSIISEENTMGQLFVDVVKGDVPEACPMDEAIISDTISHMSNIAIRTGRKVTWDPVAGKVVGDPEATRLYVRKMRNPYNI